MGNKPHKTFSEAENAFTVHKNQSQKPDDYGAMPSKC